MTAIAEPCYTILNVQDSEPYNELQIKQNLGGFHTVCMRVQCTEIFIVFQKRVKLM